MIGLLWILLALVILYILFVIVLRTPPQKLLLGLIFALAIFAVFGTLFLIVSGKWSWIWITASALFPWIGRALYLRRLFQQWQEHAVSRLSSETITLETKKINQELSIDGFLNKDLPSPPFPHPTKNQKLSSLSHEHVLSLYQYLEDHDPKAQDLLVAFCRASPLHPHDSFSEHKTHHETHSSETKNKMERKQALDILGLSEGNASRDMILKAHKRLISQLHPDKGGSNYLATMINQARDSLLSS
jgi:hypothetical protein